MKTPEFNKGEDCDFCKLLREVQKGNRSVGDLLDDPIFTERSQLMVRANSRGPGESEEITDELRDRVWRYISGFIPEYEYDYGKFFVWLRELTRDILCERLRDENEDHYQGAQDLSSKSSRNYFEGWQQPEAWLSEFESCIEVLPEPQRLACMCYFREGLSPEDTAERLNRAGYPCTPESVLLWIKDGLKTFFPQVGGFAIDETDREAGPDKSASAREKSSSATKASNPSVGNSPKR